jgi:hypothetical protein
MPTTNSVPNPERTRLAAEHARLTAELKTVASTYGSTYADAYRVCVALGANERASAALRALVVSR